MTPPAIDNGKAGRVQFFVPGIPATAGSKRAFPFRKADGKLGVRVTDSCARGKSWRDSVIAAALQVGTTLRCGPLKLTCTFSMPRPKFHYVASKREKGLRKDAPGFPTTKPDATKMLRAIEDALKGIAWHDDSQVVEQETKKRYATNEVGASITIERMGA